MMLQYGLLCFNGSGKTVRFVGNNFISVIYILYHTAKGSCEPFIPIMVIMRTGNIPDKC